MITGLAHFVVSIVTAYNFKLASRATTREQMNLSGYELTTHAGGILLYLIRGGNSEAAPTVLFGFDGSISLNLWYNYWCTDQSVRSRPGERNRRSHGRVHRRQ